MPGALLPHLACKRGLRIPFDLRILRILLPSHKSQHTLLKDPSQIGREHTSDDFDLSDTMAIPQHDTDL
jgi:hypothetical protein